MYQQYNGYAPFDTQKREYPDDAVKYFKEKAEIKNISKYIAFALLGLMLIMRFWVYPYLYVAASFGVDKNAALEFARSAAGGQIIQIMVSSAGFLIPFCSMVIMAKLRFRDIMAFGPTQKNLILPMFLIGTGFCSFANIATSVAGSIFSNFGFDFDIPTGEDPKGIFGFLLCVIASAVFPALLEEFAFRGVVYGVLSKYGEAFAIIITSVLFGFMHGNFSQIAFAFLVGLVITFVRAKTGSVWVCMLIHFTNNFIATVISFLYDKLTVTQVNIIFAIYEVIAMCLVFVGFMMLKNFKGDFEKISIKRSMVEEKEKYQVFFLSVPMIIFFLICLFESISYLI